MRNKRPNFAILNARQPSSSPIQTVLSALDSHQILPQKRLAGLEALGLHHRRSGISPRPEDESYIVVRFHYTIKKDLWEVKYLDQ